MSKLSQTVADTWRGLVQRRLWPVAALLLAGLVAVPLLLTSEPEPVPPPPVTAADEAAELAAQPLVTIASAAARESARRVLGARKDPFKPTNRRKGDKAGGDKDAGNAGSTSTPTPRTSASAPSDSSTAPSYGGGAYVAPAPRPSDARPRSGEDKPTRPAGSLSLRWGTAGDGELESREVERLDPLPDPDAPLLVYLRLSEDGRKAVFMLDADVVVEGDGRCAPDPKDCQTVELAPGETQFIEVTGEDGAKAQYQLDVVKIHGRRAARTPRRDAAAQARAARRALRSLGHPAPSYRFDARAGTLKAVTRAG